jgi:hypothetical protein
MAKVLAMIAAGKIIKRMCRILFFKRPFG